MPQGKIKVKAKIPVGAKIKQRAIAKPKDFQKRNRPALPKKATNLVREAITKAINETNETSVREKAVLDGKTLHVLPSEDVMPAPEKKGSTTSQGKGGKGTKAKNKK